MKDYVLDANAVIRYFGVGDGRGGDKVRSLFEQAERNQARLSMSVINMGEVLYILLRAYHHCRLPEISTVDGLIHHRPNIFPNVKACVSHDPDDLERRGVRLLRDLKMFADRVFSGKVLFDRPLA